VTTQPLRPARHESEIALENRIDSLLRRGAGAHTVHMFAEEADHVLRNLPEIGLKWFRANLHEDVPHVLDEDKLSLITRGFEVSVELNRLRLENQRVVDTLNKKHGRRFRSNEVCGTGKKQVSVIVFSEDLLNVGGRREPRCLLGEIGRAEKSATAVRSLGSVAYGPTSNAECGPLRAARATSSPPTLVPNANISLSFRPYIDAWLADT
jgi:hypothetical protein